MNAPTDEVRLYSTWRGLVLAFLSSGVVFLIGVLAAHESGPQLLPVVLIVVGLGLLIVLLFDFPLHTTVHAQGITRRTPLRAHTIPWATIDGINRARGGRLRKRAGPLIAGVGRRKILLVDRCEGADEYERLRAFLTVHRTSTLLIATAPEPDTTPTWLYHRKR